MASRHSRIEESITVLHVRKESTSFIHDVARVLMVPRSDVPLVTVLHVSDEIRVTRVTPHVIRLEQKVVEPDATLRARNHPRRLDVLVQPSVIRDDDGLGTKCSFHRSHSDTLRMRAVDVTVSPRVDVLHLLQ